MAVINSCEFSFSIQEGVCSCQNSVCSLIIGFLPLTLLERLTSLSTPVQSSFPLDASISPHLNALSGTMTEQYSHTRLRYRSSPHALLETAHPYILITVCALSILTERIILENTAHTEQISRSSKFQGQGQRILQFFVRDDF
jgi:hypothetical protein